MKTNNNPVKYRVRVSPNGMKTGLFDVIAQVGAVYRAFTSVRDIKDGFAEENRRHRVRKANMIRRIFE